MTQTRLALVVSQGPDLGARLELDGVARVVGRARDAALVLTDPTISRRHVEVVQEQDVAVVRVLEGASPLTHDGQARAHARVPVDGRFLIGTTVLAVARAPSVTASSDQELTDVRGLLEGTGADVRGLGAVFGLVEALDSAGPAADPTLCLQRWAREAVGATDAGVLDEEDASGHPNLAPLRRGEIVVMGDAHVSAVYVPAHGSGVGAVRFDLPLPLDDIGVTIRRMLIVGARIFTQHLSVWRDATHAREETAILRSQAIGSARAFLGTSPAANEVTTVLPRLAQSDATVLLLGESGSGKTFLARLIHEGGPREREPLRVVNCAAIPENLLESALFGHEKGAFTGATVARPGVFESAGRGTVLLDEVGEMPLASQTKLLRVLEDRAFERLGSHREIPLRARVIAATNRDLKLAVSEGTFRSDLYFRISVVTIKLPSLRERDQDIVLLARRLLADLGTTGGRRVTDFDDEALDVLRSYPWPGNVRELRNAIEHALVLGEGALIRPVDLPPSIRAAKPTVGSTTEGDSVGLPARLDWLEARAIEAAMRASGGNRTRAAALLGINRVTLYKKLKEPT